MKYLKEKYSAAASEFKSTIEAETEKIVHLTHQNLFQF